MIPSVSKYVIEQALITQIIEQNHTHYSRTQIWQFISCPSSYTHLIPSSSLSNHLSPHHPFHYILSSSIRFRLYLFRSFWSITPTSNISTSPQVLLISQVSCNHWYVLWYYSYRTQQSTSSKDTNHNVVGISNDFAHFVLCVKILDVVHLISSFWEGSV